VRGTADLTGVAVGVNLVARQMDAGDRRVVRHALEDISSGCRLHRTRPSAAGDVERLVNHLRQVREILHHEIVLGAGRVMPKVSSFLERVAADELEVTCR
jgi:hypothetical protein